MSGQICCTQRLLKELRLTQSRAGYPDPTYSPLSVWYAHLFFEKSRKCVVFLHPPTGYTLFTLWVSRKSLEEMPALLATALTTAMEEDGFSLPARSKALDAISGACYRRTNDRRAIAYINEVLRHMPWIFDRFYSQELEPSGSTMARHFNPGPYGPHWNPVKCMNEFFGEEIETKYDCDI